MESILKSDIFFFITSVVVVAIGIGTVASFFYIVSILRDVKGISRTVNQETKEMVEDISQLRTKVKSESAIVGISAFFRKLFARGKKGRNH